VASQPSWFSLDSWSQYWQSHVPGSLWAFQFGQLLSLPTILTPHAFYCSVDGWGRLLSLPLAPIVPFGVLSPLLLHGMSHLSFAQLLISLKLPWTTCMVRVALFVLIQFFHSLHFLLRQHLMQALRLTVCFLAKMQAHQRMSLCFLYCFILIIQDCTWWWLTWSCVSIWRVESQSERRWHFRDLCVNLGE
jgi:hypothetical protein